MTPHDMSRRTLLRGAAGIGFAAAAAPFLAACGDDKKKKVATLAPPETTTIRLPKIALTQGAVLAVAVDFLKEEGFTDVQFVTPSRPEAIFAEFTAGNFDVLIPPAPMVPGRIEAGDPWVVLGGVNVGCFQVFGIDAVKSLTDFRGKSIATSGPGGPDDVFLALTLANVGLELRKDVNVVVRSHDQAVQAFMAGEADGMTTYPPFNNRLRVNSIGHAVLDATIDRPWSQYYFSMPTVLRSYSEKNPVATKRLLRAMFKASDAIAKEPVRGADAMKTHGYIPDALYTATRDEIPKVPFDVWRKYDPADTLRFYALRLKESGIIKSTPEQIIARGADFKYWAELKRELKEA